ncbi:hypothetical protein FAIPA1_30228 [Frankia sp. AiPs1]
MHRPVGNVTERIREIAKIARRGPGRGWVGAGRLVSSWQPGPSCPTPRLLLTWGGFLLTWGGLVGSVDAHRGHRGIAGWPARVAAGLAVKPSPD